MYPDYIMAVSLPKQYMTTAEAATELGVIARRIRQLIDAGKLTAVKVGRDLIVDAGSVKTLKRERGKK